MPNLLIVGEVQLEISDDDVTSLATYGWVTPQDRYEVPERPVWRVDTGDGLGCLVVVDAPSYLNSLLEREWHKTENEMPPQRDTR